MAGPVCHAAGSAQTDPDDHPKSGNGLTEPEVRWLQAVWPVLLFARDAGLPVDVVVQPQPAPELPPLALAWVGGRCKFVHAALYGRVYAWPVTERLAARQRGPMHDTLAWAQRAARGEHFGSRSVFAEADALWHQGPAKTD